jgi:hypothetical protein
MRLVESLSMSDVENALRTLIDALRRNNPSKYPCDTQPPEKWQDGMMASIRYWGNWVVPDDEEDDGDYDWKILTPESSQRANSIVDQVKQQFPNVDIRWSPEEKEYITLIGKMKA